MLFEQSDLSYFISLCCGHEATNSNAFHGGQWPYDLFLEMINYIRGHFRFQHNLDLSSSSY